MVPLFLGLLIETAFAGCHVDKVTCYEEPHNKHIWRDQPNTMSTGMSQEWCAQLCFKEGHKMAGVEYGVQCYVSLCQSVITMVLISDVFSKHGFQTTLVWRQYPF